MRRYQRSVYRVAYRVASGDEEEAKDLTQESFFRIFRNIGKFDGKSSFYTWMYRVALNTCLGQRRRHRRWGNVVFSRRSGTAEGAGAAREVENRAAPEEVSDPSVAYGRRQLTEDVGRVLGSLPRKQRMVFHLRVVEEMTIPEIAAVTGMAEGTIKTHLFRATRKARNGLQQWLK
jgi:RNA polymerase sigma-70 factor (ECF subfamily)